MTDRVLALSVHQPYATLLARGHKYAEIRSRPIPGPLNTYAIRPLPGHHIEPGERIAIASTASVPYGLRNVLRRRQDDWSIGQRYEFEDWLGPYTLEPPGRGLRRLLPLGAVVGLADVVDCVPIVSYTGDPRHIAVERALAISSDRVHLYAKVGDDVIAWGDQYRFGGGLLTPGNYATILANATPLRDPVPVKGRQGVWALPDDVADRVLDAPRRRLLDLGRPPHWPAPT